MLVGYSVQLRYLITQWLIARSVSLAVLPHINIQFMTKLSWPLGSEQVELSVMTTFLVGTQGSLVYTQQGFYYFLLSVLASRLRRPKKVDTRPSLSFQVLVVLGYRLLTLLLLQFTPGINL